MKTELWAVTDKQGKGFWGWPLDYRSGTYVAPPYSLGGNGYHLFNSEALMSNLGPVIHKATGTSVQVVGGTYVCSDCKILHSYTLSPATIWALITDALDRRKIAYRGREVFDPMVAVHVNAIPETPEAYDWVTINLALGSIAFSAISSGMTGIQQERHMQYARLVEMIGA